MPTEYRSLPDGTIVARYGIIGTTETVYEAFQPSAIMGNHSSLTRYEEKWYGRVGTERLPADVDALPAMTPERFAAVSNWHAGRYEEAYRLIFQAYPEARIPGRRGYRQDMGSVRVID